MYRIVFSIQASKAMLKMSRVSARLIRLKIEHVAEDPYAIHHNVKKLQGRPGYRLRVGDWRVIYEINNAEVMIIVMKNAARGGVHR